MRSTASRPDLDGLAARRAWYEQALRMARLGAWSCDVATEELTWTDGVYDLFGISSGTRLRRSTTVALYVDRSRSDMEAFRAETLLRRRPFAMDAEIRTIRGERKWMRLTADVECHEGRPIRLFGSKQDVTPEIQALIRLRAQAERDPLTGLANRAVFDQRYRDVVRDEGRHGGVAALVLIDLDRFKEINDRYGHLAGDECLRQTAARLRQAFGDAVLVARLGGDEFAVLLRAPLGRPRIERMLDAAGRALADPVFCGGTPVAMSASIGATLIGRRHRRSPGSLFEEADGALYAAKSEGRNLVRVHDDGAPPEARSLP